MMSLIYTWLAVYPFLNECYIDKKVQYYVSINADQYMSEKYYTARDYVPYNPDLDSAARSTDILFSPYDEPCFWCDNKIPVIEERTYALGSMIRGYFFYYLKEFTNRVQCPFKNDYYFDYR